MIVHLVWSRPIVWGVINVTNAQGVNIAISVDFALTAMRPAAPSVIFVMNVQEIFIARIVGFAFFARGDRSVWNAIEMRKMAVPHYALIAGIYVYIVLTTFVNIVIDAPAAQKF